MRCNRDSSSPTSPGSTSTPKSAMCTYCLTTNGPNSPDARRNTLPGSILSPSAGGGQMDGGEGAAPVGASLPTDPDADAADAELRTFLIADVRGYTSFTQRQGDERAAKLAGKFA